MSGTHSFFPPILSHSLGGKARFSRMETASEIFRDGVPGGRCYNREAGFLGHSGGLIWQMELGANLLCWILQNGNKQGEKSAPSAHPPALFPFLIISHHLRTDLNRQQINIQFCSAGITKSDSPELPKKKKKRGLFCNIPRFSIFSWFRLLKYKYSHTIRVNIPC